MSAASTGPPASVGYVTPDAVAVDLPSATVGSRAVAYLIDLVLLGTGLLALTIAQAVFGAAGWVPDWAGILAVLLFAFLWQFGYPIGFETLWGGRTPGKAVMGLRVVTTEGAPVGVRHATIRATVGLFELTGTAGTVAVVTSLVSSRGQRLGDLAAGTLVVRERLAGPPPAAEVFVAPSGLEAYAARLDVGRLGPAEYGTIRETLRRAPTLPPPVRDRVTGQLATTLAPRVTPPPPAGVAAEDWLLAVAAAVQATSVARRAPAPVPPVLGSSVPGRPMPGPSVPGSSVPGPPVAGSPAPGSPVRGWGPGSGARPPTPSDTASSRGLDGPPRPPSEAASPHRDAEPDQRPPEAPGAGARPGGGFAPPG